MNTAKGRKIKDRIAKQVEDGFDDSNEEPLCPDCHDKGKVVAADGYHEYLGYNEVPCHCQNAFKWIGQLGPHPLHPERKDEK